MLLTKCQAVEMPAEGGVTKFKSFRETVKILSVIYADLEALLHKLTVSQKKEMEQDQQRNYKNMQHALMDTKLYVVMMIDCLNLSKCIEEWIVLINSSVTYSRKKKKF